METLRAKLVLQGTAFTEIMSREDSRVAGEPILNERPSRRPFEDGMHKHPGGIPFFRPSARQTLRMQAHKGYEPHPHFVHLMEMVAAHCNVITLFPEVYSPDELRMIEAPTLLLVGEEEKIYSSKKAIVRAERYIPNLTGVVIPEAGHTLNMERPDVVNAAVIGFLTDAQPGIASPHFYILPPN